jgi:hypothetical protein
MANPYINGFMYAWGSVEVMILGAVPLTGITSISYDEDEAMENNYGAGNFPIGQAVGPFKYTGDIEIYKEELIALQAYAPQGKIQMIPPFTIKIVYGGDESALVIDTLTNCRFMKNPFSSKSGDMKMVSKIPLLIGGIEWGV